MSGDSEGAHRIDLANQFIWGNALAKYLRENLTPSHTQIDLSTCHVDERCTQMLIDAMTSESSCLQSLCLARSRLTVDCSCKIFAALPKSKVEHLIMDDNVLTLQACRVLGSALNENPPLVYLSLRNCTINYKGCNAIAEALPRARNCRVLILDSNCIFMDGMKVLSEALSTSTITALSVADNQIWEEGTTLLLSKGVSHLTSLDLSYNAVNLIELSNCLKENTNLKHVSITGCKVNVVDQLALFLEDLAKSQLETFIVEGLNEKQLPISWPHATEYVWSNRGPGSHQHFDAILRTLKFSKTLSDLRLGFLDLDQIHSLVKGCENFQITRQISVTLSDFGRTGATWIIRFPEFSLEAPTTTFEWAAPITSTVAQLIGPTFKSSICGDKMLDSLTLRNTGLTDELVQNLFAGFRDMEPRFVKVDLTGNELTDAMVDRISPFLPHMYIEELILEDTKMTEHGFRRFFSLFTGAHPDKVPKAVSFSFEQPEGSESITHDFFDEIAMLIGRNSALERLKIRGPASPQDVIKLTDVLSGSSHMRTLIIETPTAPKKEEEVKDSEVITHLVESLGAALTAADTTCRLSTFVFPPIMDVFSIGGHILDVWGQIEEKLEENKTK